MKTEKIITLITQGMRTLSRMPGYTLLSLLGLVLSLSGTVIIARYLHQEWTIDHWMPDLDRTYILMWEAGDDLFYPSTGQISSKDETPRPQQTSSYVEGWTEVFLSAEPMELHTNDEEFYSVSTIYVDTMFCEIYPLKAVEGTLQIKTPEDVIVSEELASRIFPDKSAVGQTLTYNKDRVYRIVGVFRQPPTKSHLCFDMACNSYKAVDRTSADFSIVRLHKGAKMEDFNSTQKRIKIYDKYETIFQLVPYGRIPFETIINAYGRGACLSAISPSFHLWMLLAVCVLLFFVGVFNFLNLQAVMLRKRSHEMQVRRIFGASLWDIFWQLYMECFIVSVLAILGVWMVIEIVTPHMKDWFSIEQMTMPVFDTALSLSIMFLLPLIATVPSLLKRNERTERGSAAFLFLQYFISLTLITVSLYLMRQLHFMMNSDPGFKTEGLLAFSAQLDDMNGMNFFNLDEANDYWKKLNETKALLLSRLVESPYIHHVEMNPYFTMYRYMGIQGGSSLKIGETGVELSPISITPNQFEMLGLSMKDGRMFCDSLDQGAAHCILNETALRLLGVKDWRTEKVPLNKNFIRDIPSHEDEIIDFDIVGIMRDFHPYRMSEPQQGAFFVYLPNLEFLSPYSPMEYLVDVEPGSEEKAVHFIEQTKKELFHGRKDIGHHWISDDIKNLYQEDRRTARIFFTFSLLAIGVTCLGVLGLMMFEIRGRRREIALRKVHGARLPDIALLLSRRYLIILGIAAAVSIPASLIGLHKLITRYYTIHASIVWWIPFVSLLIVFLLSALTLWQQLWQAARTEPGKVMKVEN